MIIIVDMKTEKKCKGTGKAIGYGCEKIVPVAMYDKPNRKYGLGISCGCYKKWLTESEEGREIVQKTTLKYAGSTLKQKIKEAEDQRREKSPEIDPKKWYATLQSEINKLARMIDIKFGYDGCIDCGKPFTQGRDRDGGHFKSRGHNPSLRYNLHNIHSQKSSCNSNGLGGGKTLGYYRGLQQRYGDHYAEYIDKQLQITYHYIGVRPNEIRDYLKIVRQIIRNFDTFQWSDSIVARDQCNTMIGIYHEQYASLKR